MQVLTHCCDFGSGGDSNSRHCPCGRNAGALSDELNASWKVTRQRRYRITQSATIEHQEESSIKYDDQRIQT